MEKKELRMRNEYPDEVNSIVDNMSLMDDDLMSKVFENNIPASELLLSTLLGEEVTVSESNGQVEMNNPMIDGRNITVDILARDLNGRLFNCEVQRRNSGADPRRVRFHSSMLDVRALKKNEDFRRIRDSYVIFITEDDYYEAGKPFYYVTRNVSIDDSMVPFNDGNVIIYVNGSYEGDDSIGHLMSDFRNRTTEGFYNTVLGEAVGHFKLDEGGRKTMCDAVERYAEKRYTVGISEGRYEGRMEGQLELIRNLMSNLSLTAEQALHNLGIPENEHSKYLARL